MLLSIKRDIKERPCISLAHRTLTICNISNQVNKEEISTGTHNAAQTTLGHQINNTAIT